MQQMKILTIDNERLALGLLNDAIAQTAPDAELTSFTRVSEALRAVEQNGYRPDVAFLDIEMPGMTGLELASRIKKTAPMTWLIFVTGYSQFALEAFSVHAGGYLLKPVTPQRIAEELALVGRLQPAEPVPHHPLRVQCFGNFEVFADGKPVSFSRKKAKELFAYLVHKRGTTSSTRELAAVLFEDAPYDLTHQSYLQTLISNLCHTLKEVGEESVIVRSFGSLSVDTSRLDCDYYRFLAMDAAAVNAYTGEYMSQYEWAEFTIDFLNRRI